MAKLLLKEHSLLKHGGGGVVLLHGSALSTVDRALQQLLRGAPPPEAIRLVPSDHAWGPQAPLLEAARLAQDGLVAVVKAPQSRLDLARLLRAHGVRATSVFLYASPATLAGAASEPRQALQDLQSFYHAVGGSLDKGADLGLLRSADIQRAVANVRHRVPPGSALTAQCDRVERDLHSALGLGDQRAVHLHPRAAHDAALDVGDLRDLYRRAIAGLSGTSARGGAASSAAGTPLVGTDLTTAPAAPATGIGAGAGTCQEYNIVQDSVNAAAVPAAAAGASLATLRKALAADGGSASGFMFLNSNGFPISSTNEAGTSIDTVAQDCVVEMASRKPPTPQAQEDRAAQQQAAAALGQEQLANAQARKEASVAAGRAAEERLAPAVTAGPATLEQVTATGASSTGEVHHAPTLTKEQWRVVFEGNNLTRGYIIGSNGPMPAERAIFQWKPEVVNYAVDDASKVKATLCKTMEAASSVASGYTSVSGGISAGVPMGAGVGIEASHTNAKSKSKANAGAQSQKVIQWMYPRVTIWPRESLELSPSYLAAVKDALNEPDAELKAQKLLDIDSQYGDYYPFSVSLGGKRYLVEDSDATSQSFGNSSTKESSVGASVSYRGVTVSGSAAGGKTKSKEKSQGTQGSSSDVQAVGGNSLLTDDAAWVASLADSKFWRVIEFGHFQTVASLLPKDLANSIDDLKDDEAFANVYSDAEDNAESLAFASKYDRKTVAIRMQSRYLGVKALARDDATALFRAKPLSIPYLKTVAWAVKRQEDCVKLKALGGEDGLYLHMSKKGVPVLAPNMSGDKGQFQLWRINNANGKLEFYNKGAKKLLAIGSTKVKVRVQDPPSVDNQTVAYDVTEQKSNNINLISSRGLNNFWPKVKKLILGLNETQWEYWQAAWRLEPATLRLTCKDVHGKDQNIMKTYGLRLPNGDRNQVMDDAESQFWDYLGAFQKHVEKEVGKSKKKKKLNLEITQLHYMLVFPDADAMAPYNSEAVEAAGTGTTKSDPRKTQFDVDELAVDMGARIPSMEVSTGKGNEKDTVSVKLLGCYDHNRKLVKKGPDEDTFPYHKRATQAECRKVAEENGYRYYGLGPKGDDCFCSNTMKYTEKDKKYYGKKKKKKSKKCGEMMVYEITESSR